MSITKKYLQLEKELKKYSHLLVRAAIAMKDNEVSDFPIFVAHKDEIELGLSLIDKNNKGLNWSINVSSLEEFVAKSLILPIKIEDFKESYKKIDTHLCFFVLSELGAQFIYLALEKNES